MTQQLQHLAGAYFHQDYDLDSDSPDSVIDSFREGEGEASAAELISEIDRLLSSHLSQSEMLDLWVKAWGASYDPQDDGLDIASGSMLCATGVEPGALSDRLCRRPRSLMPN